MSYLQPFEKTRSILDTTLTPNTTREFVDSSSSEPGNNSRENIVSISQNNSGEIIEIDASVEENDNMANEMSFKTIEKLNPTYDGTGDIRDYLNTIQSLYNLCPENQRQYFVLFAKYRLQGSARDLVSGLNIEDFGGFVEQMGNLFRPDNSNIVTQDEFTRCRQMEGETVQEFAARVQMAKRRIIDQLPVAQVAAGTLVLENQALGIFVSGLRPEIQQILKIRNIDSFENALRIAKTEEKILLNAKITGNESIKTVCAWCKKTDHVVTNCLDFALSKPLSGLNQNQANNEMNAQSVNQNNRSSAPRNRNYYSSYNQNNSNNNSFPNRNNNQFQNRNNSNFSFNRNNNNFSFNRNNNNNSPRGNFSNRNSQPFPSRNFNQTGNDFRSLPNRPNFSPYNYRNNGPPPPFNQQNNYQNVANQNRVTDPVLEAIDNIAQRLENLESNLSANNRSGAIQPLNCICQDLPAGFLERLKI